MPWRVRSISAPARRRAPIIGKKTSCAENGDGYGFDPDLLVPMPHATKPDF